MSAEQKCELVDFKDKKVSILDIPVIVTTPFRSMLTSHFQVSKRTIFELSY